MITTPLLDEKDKVQKKLEVEAHHNVSEYFELAHRIVADVSSKYGYRFKYGNLRGGEIEPAQTHQKKEKKKEKKGSEPFSGEKGVRALFKEKKGSEPFST
jgi:hypothetical protein